MSENISAKSYYETDIEKNKSDLDYYPSSDGSEGENFHSDSLVEIKNTRPILDETVFLVFWSCLTQPIQRWSICLTPAIIERSFVIGKMIIVDSLCKNQHRTTWR